MGHAERLTRELRLVLLLSRHPRGLSSRNLAAELGCGRATVDRDLKLLRARVGLRIEPTRVNGEVWHRLDGATLQLIVTPAQLAALAVARDLLTPLAGTELARALEGLPSSASSTVRLDGRRISHDADVVATLEAAIVSGMRVSIDTRVASRDGERRSYVLEPITLRLARGEIYLDAWSVERDALRTFKVTRIQSVETLAERAAPHSDVDLEAVFANAVKTWSGEVVPVRIRIAPDVAWIVPEYPLVANQQITHEPSGAATVQAEVAGLVETARWVLGWGRNAEVLEPPELREMILEELRGALAGYESDPPRSPIVSGAEDPAPTDRRPRRPRSTTRTKEVRGGEPEA